MFPKDSSSRDAAARRTSTPSACPQSWQFALRPVWGFACLHACIGDKPRTCVGTCPHGWSEGQATSSFRPGMIPNLTRQSSASRTICLLPCLSACLPVCLLASSASDGLTLRRSSLWLHAQRHPWSAVVCRGQALNHLETPSPAPLPFPGNPSFRLSCPSR